MVKRCAIYTRKSTEEGLDQAFNSLDAQREACSAYVSSQAGEGWKALQDRYDDGGFSGGSLDRPALKRLLADIEAGLIDIVVVYKVDRLTRSLTDFAKLVERFDAKDASFVSVTQAFNTTNSMGRLTLNVLLSFAQFEREVTAERIRDKIALSKARGMWMGGMIPLGYDRRDGALVINETEAEHVREIFRRYLEVKSVRRLRVELTQAGFRSKRWTTSTGKTLGGAIMGVGSLFHTLRNRLYVGEIIHKGQVHQGQHKAIVERELFETVQVQLKTNCETFAQRPIKAATACFVGRIFDEAGRPMTPTFGYSKAKRIYRYYVSRPADLLGLDQADQKPSRVSAPLLEAEIASALTRLLGREVSSAETSKLVNRVDLQPESIEVVFRATVHANAELGFADMAARLTDGEEFAREDPGGRLVRLRMAMSPRLRGGRSWLGGRRAAVVATADRELIQGLRTAHRQLLALGVSPLSDSETLSTARAPASLYTRRLGQLAFLAPDLQQKILNGQPLPGLRVGIVVRSELPLAWADQRTWIESFRATNIGRN